MKVTKMPKMTKCSIKLSTHDIFNRMYQGKNFSLLFDNIYHKYDFKLKKVSFPLVLHFTRLHATNHSAENLHWGYSSVVSMSPKLAKDESLSLIKINTSLDKQISNIFLITFFAV